MKFSYDFMCLERFKNAMETRARYKHWVSEGGSLRLARKLYKQLMGEVAELSEFLLNAGDDEVDEDEDERQYSGPYLHIRLEEE